MRDAAEARSASFPNFRYSHFTALSPPVGQRSNSTQVLACKVAALAGPRGCLSRDADRASSATVTRLLGGRRQKGRLVAHRSATLILICNPLPAVARRMRRTLHSQASQDPVRLVSPPEESARRWVNEVIFSNAGLVGSAQGVDGYISWVGDPGAVSHS
ncbi:hypothetical protein OH76DRAFT_186318 [Lentinus brumalis]|uniref:Uncharacterized protein n=1 Tax=Lentinus brumalis TaxID=2498619 RepID=A0A371CMZ9_9APHY|nr:hypothetical protein OH76DRAFT_186318 [Polyporus brumalis]